MTTSPTRHNALLLPLLLLALVLTSCRTTQQDAAASASAAAPSTPPTRAMVVAAHPLAVEAGTKVLARGGSAMDAAFAVQLMLGLVEPQSSGIGGGAFIMAYDASSGRVNAYLGREQAPASAAPAMLRDAQGMPFSSDRAKLSGHASGVPGAIAVFDLALKDHGKLPWDELFTDTIKRAEQGFTITPRLHQHIHGSFVQAKAPDIVRYFDAGNGKRMRSGDTLRNAAYAQTLRMLATGGARAFYEGPIAKAIVERVQQAPDAGGMSLADLANYRAEKVEPLCGPVRDKKMCVPPPPSSGVGLLQLMALLDGTDISERGPQDAEAWFLFAEASRVMYADRDRYVGDPRFIHVPVEGLLDPSYVRQRGALIGKHAAPAGYAAGVPAGAPAVAEDRTREPAGTTHFVVVDRQGNAVSVTSTIESFFGSGRMVGGFVLNNQMTDFAWDLQDGQPGMANAIAAGKRPRSSMSPSVLLDGQGRFVGAIGSPGGSAIPAYVGKALLGALYWNLPLEQAIALPNLVARGRNFNGEAGRFDPAILQALRSRGIDVRAGSGEDSGLHGVLLRDGRWEWGADPRREGSAHVDE